MLILSMIFFGDTGTLLVSGSNRRIHLSERGLLAQADIAIAICDIMDLNHDCDTAHYCIAAI